MLTLSRLTRTVMEAPEEARVVRSTENAPLFIEAGRLLVRWFGFTSLIEAL